MKQVTLLGATGSIGSSTLDVIRRHSDMFRLHGAAASKSVDKMVEIVREFHPARVAMSDEASAVKLIEKLKEQNLFTDVLVGDDGVEALAGDGGADIVVGAIVGAAGLRPVMAAVKT
ncbi:MAG: 1-deoxy-D-xylulose-5-phosphate reductoisomerase, partial [Succinivibrio sp.]